MSSEHSSGRFPAANCIDGSTSNFCHTDAATGGESNPWLSIDLGSATRVESVVVYNRASCCQDRLSPFEVWVGSAAGDTSGTQCGGGAQTVAATVGPFTVDCGGAIGSHVTVRLPGEDRILNIAEVQAHGGPVDVWSVMTVGVWPSLAYTNGHTSSLTVDANGTMSYEGLSLRPTPAGSRLPPDRAAQNDDPRYTFADGWLFRPWARPTAWEFLRFNGSTVVVHHFCTDASCSGGTSPLGSPNYCCSAEGTLGAPCPRSASSWCGHAGSTYADTIDCDGDDIPDPWCSDTEGNAGFLGSASGCASTWACAELRSRKP